MGGRGVRGTMASWVTAAVGLAVGVAGAVVPVAGPSAGPAGAVPVQTGPGEVETVLSISNPHDVAVDASTGDVVVVGPGGMEVLAADGTSEGASAEPANGSEVVAAGGVAYVLSWHPAEVVRVDLVDREVTGRWPLAPLNDAVGLVVTGGRVFTTAVDPETGGAVLVSVDPSTGDVTTEAAGTVHTPKEVWRPMRLAVSPIDPDLIVGVPDTGSVHTGRLFDVGESPAAVVASAALGGSMVPSGRAQGVTFTPDGSRVVVAGSGRFDELEGLVELAADDLALSGTIYPSQSGAIDVTASSTGLIAALGRGTEIHPSLLVYRQGDPAPIMARQVHPKQAGTPSYRGIPGGLAFSPDGSRVHVVQTDGGEESRVLTVPVVEDPPAPIAEARAIAVDPGTGRVLVGGDDAVVVHDPAGRPLARLDGMPAVSQLVAAQGAVWALLPAISSVARIDPVTMTETGRWPVTGAQALEGLAVARGRVWTHGWVDATETGALASIDPATGAVGLHATTSRGLLVSSPVASDLLVQVAEPPSDYVTVVRVAADGRPSVVKEVATGLTYLRSAAVSADGTRLQVTGTSSPYRMEEWSLPGLQRLATYSLQRGYTVATAAAADGRKVLGLDDSDFPVEDVAVYPPTGTTPTVAFDVATGDHELVHDGIRFSPDGRRLYAIRQVFRTGKPGPADLVVMDLAARHRTTYPRSVGLRGGGEVTVTGSGLAGVRASLEGTDLTVVRSSATSATVRVPGFGLYELPGAGFPQGLRFENGTGLVPAGPSVRYVPLGPFRTGPAFADRISRDVRGRPATVAEQQSEDARLAGGGRPADLVVWLSGLAEVQRPRADVIRLYWAAFGRSPDLDGLRYWVGQIRAGRTSTSRMAEQFAGTAEFRKLYGGVSDDAYVEVVYYRVLGRQGEAAGLAYWRSQVRAGMSRGRMLDKVAQSAESRTLQAARVEVVGVYADLLRRMPTTTELDRHLALRRTEYRWTLASDAEELMLGTEYAARIG